jgi:hypothetical protein
MRPSHRSARSCFSLFLFAALPLLSVSCKPKETAAPLVPADYAAWKKTTAVQLDYPIPGHESSVRTIFMNGEGFQFQHDAAGVEFPPGTVIVKEIRPLGAAAAGLPAPMLTVMEKRPEDERARGGWLWIVRDTATRADTLFTSDFCLRCHGNANESHPYADRNPSGEFRDYVFFVPGKDIPAPSP